MTENCTNCIMIGDIDRMKKDIEKNEVHTNETEKVVYEIKESHSQTRFLMEQIQKNQEAQALSSEKRETALALAKVKDQELVAQTNKDISDKMAAGFKAIEDRRIANEKIIADKKDADEKAAVLEEKEAIKEKLRLKELQDVKDEAARLEKKADRKAKTVQTWSLFLIGVGILANFIMGILVKYAPTWIGLPVGK